MSDTQNTTQYVSASDNAGYTQANVLQIRLNTDPILERIERYLSGLERRTIYNKETGDYQTQIVQLSAPRLNQEGVNNIMGWLEGSINPQTVQGNFDEEQFYNYKSDFRADLAEMLYLNADAWQLKKNDYSNVINFIMKLVEPFFTRLIDNKERDSYAATIQHRESSTVAQGGGFNLFNKK